MTKDCSCVKGHFYFLLSSLKSVEAHLDSKIEFKKRRDF